MVHRPPHYNQGGVECIKAIEAALGPDGFRAYLRGTIMRYTWRLELKSAPRQDAEKTAWYLAELVRVLKDKEAQGLLTAGMVSGAALDLMKQSNDFIKTMDEKKPLPGRPLRIRMPVDYQTFEAHRQHEAQMELREVRNAQRRARYATRVARRAKA